MKLRDLHIPSMKLSVLFALLMIYGCAQNPLNEKQQIQQKIVWPAFPAQAKIEYKGSFSKPADLGINRGVWTKLVDFFTGSPGIYLVRPMAVVRDQHGVIYVADPGAKGVHRFDQGNNSYHLIQQKNNRPLLSPVALLLDGESSLIISDSALGSLFVVKSGEFIAHRLDTEIALKQPTGLALGALDNDFYVVDTVAHKVIHFDRNGRVIHQFGSRGHADGEFNYPTMINYNNNQLLITDSLNFRIQIFDASGEYVSKFGKLGDATGYHSRPKGVAIDRDENIYVVDGLFHSVQLFAKTGDFLMRFGEQGQAAGQFWLPTGIFIDQQQIIYVADSHNRRVQMFSYLGAVQ